VLYLVAFKAPSLLQEAVDSDAGGLYRVSQAVADEAVHARQRKDARASGMAALKAARATVS
jgi:hypothetical protein